MKQVSLIINVVLALAVVVLYYLHFSGGKSEAGEVEEGKTEAMGDLKIAFINADTVLQHYDYFKDRRDKLEAKGKKMDTDLKNRAAGLQREITSYQNTVSNLTIGQAKAIEEDLAKKQQNLRLYQESLAQELTTDQGRLNEELYDKITSYLKEYGSRNGIHAVFKFDPTSDLLYAGEAMDITGEIISGLNESYKQQQAQPADSTKSK